MASCFREDPSVHDGLEGAGTTSTSTSATQASGATPPTSSTGTTEQGDASSDASVTASTSTTGGEDGCEAPVEIAVEDPFGDGQMQTISVNFDDLPGAPGTNAELCISFSTSNPASARTLTIGEQLLAFGPCGGTRRSWSQCVEYLKPAGVVDVTIDNTTFGPGCQNGEMHDLVLQFGCPSVGESSSG